MSPANKETLDTYCVQVFVRAGHDAGLHARSVLPVLIDFPIYFVEYLFIERRRVVSFDGDAKTIRIDIVDYHIIVLSENTHDLRPFIFFAIYSVVFHNASILYLSIDRRYQGLDKIHTRMTLTRRQRLVEITGWQAVNIA
jgi:hypothetical protein